MAHRRRSGPMRFPASSNIRRQPDRSIPEPGVDGRRSSSALRELRCACLLLFAIVRQEGAMRHGCMPYDRCARDVGAAARGGSAHRSCVHAPGSDARASTKVYAAASRGDPASSPMLKRASHLQTLRRRRLSTRHVDAPAARRPDAGTFEAAARSSRIRSRAALYNAAHNGGTSTSCSARGALRFTALMTSILPVAAGQRPGSSRQRARAPRRRAVFSARADVLIPEA